MAERVKEDLIDIKQFEQMVKMQMTDEELQEFFGVNSGQLYKWVKKVYKVKSPLVQIKKLRAQGKRVFLAMQWKLAEKNPAVAIWLGKNYFGQTDESESSSKAEIEDLTPLAELLRPSPSGDSNDENTND